MRCWQGFPLSLIKYAFKFGVFATLGLLKPQHRVSEGNDVFTAAEGRLSLRCLNVPTGAVNRFDCVIWLPFLVAADLQCVTRRLLLKNVSAGRQKNKNKKKPSIQAEVAACLCRVLNQTQSNKTYFKKKKVICFTGK